MVRRTAWVMLLVLTLGVIAAAGCGGGGGGAEGTTGAQTAGGEAQPPAQPVKIRMGWGIPAEEVKYVMMEDPQIAPNLGTWYDIEWHQFAGTALGVQGLAAGTLDCATVGGLSSANGFEQGADFVLTGEIIEEATPPQDFSTTWLALKSSGIKTLDDIKGKTVATSAIGGSTDYLQDFYIQDQTGMKPGVDYKKVEIPFSQQQEALLAGRIDVGIFPQPFWGAVTAKADTQQLFRVTDVVNPFVQLLNGCRRDFIQQHPDAMKKFIEDWVTVTNWLRDPANRDTVIGITSKVMQIPRDVLETYLLTSKDYLRPENGAIDREALQNEWDFFQQRGGIKTNLKVDDYIMADYSAGSSG